MLREVSIPFFILLLFLKLWHYNTIRQEVNCMLVLKAYEDLCS